MLDSCWASMHCLDSGPAPEAFVKSITPFSRLPAGEQAAIVALQGALIEDVGEAATDFLYRGWEYLYLSPEILEGFQGK